MPPSSLMPSSATARVTSSLSMRWSGSWNRRTTSWSCVCLTEMSSRVPVYGPSLVNSLRGGGILTHSNYVRVVIGLFILILAIRFDWRKPWDMLPGLLKMCRQNWKFQSWKKELTDKTFVLNVDIESHTRRFLWLKISLVSRSHILHDIRLSV